MSTPSFPIKWVSEKILRQIFNDNYLKQVVSGKYRKSIEMSTHMSDPPEGEPFCTQSQYIRYYTEDNKFVAGAHQYMRPDGSIGASGKPDPKQVFYNNIIYAYKENKS